MLNDDFICLLTAVGCVVGGIIVGSATSGFWMTLMAIGLIVVGLRSLWLHRTYDSDFDLGDIDRGQFGP